LGGVLFGVGWYGCMEMADGRCKKLPLPRCVLEREVFLRVVV
jgi:hypothetical protein